MQSRRLACVLISLVIIASLSLSSCSRQEKPFASGQTIDAATLPGVKGDTAYAEVSAAALPAIYDSFTATLSDLGLVKWDARFDCNHFADLYVATAQVKFAAQSWHSTTPAQSLALGVLWYRPNPADLLTGHAIVEARTDRGVVYIEPQTGKQLSLSPAQLSTAYFRKW